ncbi:MAG: Rrf2 family transcriptional regulator [Candidatus Mcinerneyibacterium aminivorans]|uniref:Rrf2 family transcriptional regulator n=1 Tax=Candidatus Mcinerneyibacterium aminivorans TaxID=2703815 RepID=A0A5D0M999_9BACT|nr:MAG: Rrf2 family transcriptional regulator [Candidatus Mcinerneyibacterium aminivorans]
MNLTTKSEYALLSLVYLAKHPDEHTNINKIIKKYSIPKKYLEKILTVLKQTRYIKTKRGPKGGYKLSKKPANITLAEIIRLMDGALAPTESVSKYYYSETPISKEEKLVNIMSEIRDYISTKLEKTTIKDII